MLENKEKNKTKAKSLPYLPLPVVDSNATRTILSYRKDLVSKPEPLTPVDQDPFGLFGEAENKSSTHVTAIGLASFDQKYDMNLAQQWKDLEEEMYECVNITPVPPFFRTHTQCLSSFTKNNLKPYCVINGTY